MDTIKDREPEDREYPAEAVADSAPAWEAAAWSEYLFERAGGY